MESSIPNKQEIIWTTSNVFWIVQFIWNIPKDNEQYLLRITPWRSISKLYRRLYYTSKNNERIRRKDNPIFENCKETQFVF